MNHLKPLYELRWFWVALITPPALGVISAIPIFFSMKLQLCGSNACYSNFLDYFKLPLGIAAISFPLVALVIASHRSKQTAEQIISSNAQNTFANYFKHKEEFFKFLEKLESELDIKFQKADTLYKKIFPDNSTTNVVVTLNKYRLLGTFIGNILIQYKEIIEPISTRSICTEPQMTAVLVNTVKLVNSLNFKCNKFVHYHPTDTADPYQRLQLGFNDDDPLYQVRICHDVMVSLVGFCGISFVDIEVPEIYSEFIELFYEAIAN